jgi:hypothetical protein
MEMTFPHHSLRQDPVTSRNETKAILATVAARQADSRTVRILRQAERGGLPHGNDAEQRIRYFAKQDVQKMAVRGAFWRHTEVKPNAELDVYQSGSVYFKDQYLDHASTGEHLTLAGHGALRTI